MTALFFRIPSTDIITRPQQFRVAYGSDVFVAYAEVRSWGYVDQSRGRVVVIELNNYDYEQGDNQLFVAKDGSWVNQLINEASDIGSLGLRVAAGGFYGQFDPSTSITFPAPNTWVELTSSVVAMLPYSSAGTSNCTYDTVNNRLVLDWVNPVPVAASWMQGIAVMTVAATSNNQTYAVAWGVDGVVEPDFQVRFIRENPNDSETVTLTGHRQVPNGTSLSLFVRNIGDVSPISVSNINFRFFGGNNL